LASAVVARSAPARGAEPNLNCPFLGAAEDRQLDLTVGRVERLEQVVRASDRTTGRLHDQVALGDAGPRCWAVVFHVLYEQSVGFRKTDGPPQPARDMCRRDADPEPNPRCRLTAGQRVHAGAQTGVCRDREVEALAEPVGVHSEHPAVGADDRSAGRTWQQRRVMFDVSRDSTTSRAAEAALDAGHEAQRDPQTPSAGVGEREDRGADAGSTVGRPLDGRRVSNVDLDDCEVAVDVCPTDLAVGRAPIGERDPHLLAADVVRVRQHLSAADHDAGSDAPALPDADDRGSGLLGHPSDLCLDLVENSHRILRVTSNLQVTTHYLRREAIVDTLYAMSEQDRSVRGHASSPLAEALGRVGDRWMLLVVHTLLGGPRRFNDLLEQTPGIAPNVLSDRLKRLERDSLVVSRPYTERPPRAAYELTAEGKELAGALRLLADWGARHALPAEAPRHRLCGTVIEARWYCPTCDRLVEDEPEIEMHFL
jgi:DNA-binding HxlR family transcriptional regulator